MELSESAVVSRDGVVVERRLEPSRKGLLATFELRAAAPVRVQVVDELPGALPVAAAGFENRDSLEAGRAGPDCVTATVAVAGGSGRFGYGLELSGPPENARVEPPSVAAVDAADDGLEVADPPSVDADPPEDPAPSAVDRRLETIAGRAERLADGLSDGSTDDDAAVVRDRLAALESDLEAVATALESAADQPNDDRLADVERLRLALDADDESR
jgi:hypothetical protein